MLDRQPLLRHRAHSRVLHERLESLQYQQVVVSVKMAREACHECSSERTVRMSGVGSVIVIQMVISGRVNDSA